MSSEVLRQAITAVQAGNRKKAEALLLALVQEDPYNEMAWLWLSDVVQNVEDRIIALENAIAINPQRVQTRKRLAQIRQTTPVPVNGSQSSTITTENGRRQEAYRDLIEQVQHAPDDAAAWFALSQLVDNVEDQIIFLQKAVRYNPNHRQARKRLTQLQLAHQDELALGKAYEAQNALGQAAKAYRWATKHSSSSTDVAIARKRLKQVGRFKHLYGQNGAFFPPEEPVRNYALAQGRKAEEQGEWDQAIAAYTMATRSAPTAVSRTIAQKRLETAVRQQQLPAIKLTSPTTTLWRLGVGPVLLYTFLLLLHGGLNPFRLPFLLLAGGISVIIGSFTLVAVMITPHHALAKKLLGANGRADRLTRALLNFLGLLLILVPFLLLFINAIQRLAHYTPVIPAFN